MDRRRTKPYTQTGLSRLACFRCDARPATAQWRMSICAAGNDNSYRPMCRTCDIALNAAVMKWARLPSWRERIAEYRKAV
jgi:hypothetical protein